MAQVLLLLPSYGFFAPLPSAPQYQYHAHSKTAKKERMETWATEGPMASTASQDGHGFGDSASH